MCWENPQGALTVQVGRDSAGLDSHQVAPDTVHDRLEDGDATEL